MQDRSDGIVVEGGAAIGLPRPSLSRRGPARRAAGSRSATPCEILDATPRSHWPPRRYRRDPAIYTQMHLTRTAGRLVMAGEARSLGDGGSAGQPSQPLLRVPAVLDDGLSLPGGRRDCGRVGRGSDRSPKALWQRGTTGGLSPLTASQRRTRITGSGAMCSFGPYREGESLRRLPTFLLRYEWMVGRHVRRDVVYPRATRPGRMKS